MGTNADLLLPHAFVDERLPWGQGDNITSVPSVLYNSCAQRYSHKTLMTGLYTGFEIS